MPYRRKAYKKSYSRRRTRKTRRSGRAQRIVIEVRHTGVPQGPGAVSPTLGKKAPQQLRPRF